MMRFLMEHNLDKFNIIKYNGKVSVSGQTSLVFELLDITLQDYLLTLEDFMTMEEIKSVIQQVRNKTWTIATYLQTLFVKNLVTFTSVFMLSSLLLPFSSLADVDSSRCPGQGRCDPH